MDAPRSYHDPDSQYLAVKGEEDGGELVCNSDHLRRSNKAPAPGAKHPKVGPGPGATTGEVILLLIHTT